MSQVATKEDLQALSEKLEEALKARRKVGVSDIRISLVGAFAALLTMGAPGGLVIANHYRIQQHLENTRIHADETRSSLFGGVAYAGEMLQKERQTYFMLKALHCGNTTNAAPVLCASNYPDGPFPLLTPVK